MSTLAQRRGARKQYKRAAEMTKPGEGARFKALEKSAKMSGASNPAAVAAAAGRKKYGPKKFAAMAAAGRKKS
jgi:hypothetical protein